MSTRIFSQGDHDMLASLFQRGGQPFTIIGSELEEGAADCWICIGSADGEVTIHADDPMVLAALGQELTRKAVELQERLDRAVRQQQVARLRDEAMGAVPAFVTQKP